MKYKIKLISLGIAISMLLSTGIPVHAGQADDATLNMLKDVLPMDTSQNNGDVLPMQYVDSLEDIELKEQEQVEVIDLPQPDEVVAAPKIGTQVDPADLSGSRLLNRTRSTTDGYFDDYIETAGGYKAYSIVLAGGKYLQAKLDIPHDAGIDYDLFILDQNGVVVAYSQYGTYLNGSEGTVSEATGYLIPLTNPTDFIYIESVSGASITQPFTIHYSVSDPGEFDKFEISANNRSNDNSTEASEISVTDNIVTIVNRNISSPIDSDWYKIVVPTNREYDNLNLSVTTASSNTCALEVYTNLGSTYHFLQRIPLTNGVLSVTNGTYYIRVTNTAPAFSSGDIQKYALSVAPGLRPDGIMITELVGSESSPYVAYPGFDVRFRTEPSHPVEIYGLVYAISGGYQYPIANTAVTGMYFNPYWYSQNNDYLALSYGEAVTNASGQFTVTVIPRYVYGMYSITHAMSIQYRDSVEFAAYVTNNPGIMDSEIAWAIRSVYTG